jgi:2-keto-4-pentenoate hydratase
MADDRLNGQTTMSFDVERAAALLVDARQQHRQVEPFAPGPTGVGDAYAVQDVVAQRLGPIGAWKVGAKAPGQVPNAAPILANLIRPSPADWPASSLHMIGIEAELAFRLGRDVAPRDGPLDRGEIWAAIESVHAAVEIVDTRLTGWKNADRLWVLADNQSNGGLVYDPQGVPLRGMPLADAPVRLVIDGRTVVEGRGGNPAGDPSWLVEWLVEHCARRRGGLRAGMLVTTGSCTGMPFVEPGASVEAVFDGIGRVVLRF